MRAARICKLSWARLVFEYVMCCNALAKTVLEKCPGRGARGSLARLGRARAFDNTRNGSELHHKCFI